MNVLAFLSSEELRRLHLACPAQDCIRAVQNAFSLFNLAASSAWDLVIVDPDMSTGNDRAEFFLRLAECSQPLVIYTALSRTSARLIADLSAHCLAAVIIFDFDDSPEFLYHSLERVPAQFLGAQVVARIGLNIDALQAALRRATLATFCSAKPLRTVKDYSALAGLTRRSVDRSLERVGLRPAKWLVASAQFLRAYPLIQSQKIPYAGIGRLVGYGSVRALQHSALILTGNNLAHLRDSESLNIIDLIERAVRN